MNFISSFIHRRIGHRSNLFKIIKNISWLSFDQFLRIGAGLLVGLWVARHLGPEQFGLLNYALAFTGLFGVIAALGLKGIVVQDIVRNPDRACETLGTAAVLQLIGGLVAYLLLLVAIAYLHPDDTLARSIVGILGLMILLKASDIVLFWFESQVQSKYIVGVQNSVLLVFTAIKVVMILQQAPLIAFVWATLGEALLIAVILLVVMSKFGLPFLNLRYNTARAKMLLKESWPLALSSISIVVYMRVDQVMLAEMIDNEAVGVYSAAVRLVEGLYFLPSIVVMSAGPTIVKRFQIDWAAANFFVQDLYDILFVISLLFATTLWISSDFLIALLYGEPYREAATILAVYGWNLIFVSMGVTQGKWLIANNLHRYCYIYILMSMVLNVLGNFLLIPHWGGLGAAYATVASTISATLIFPALFKKTRLSSLMAIKSLNPKHWKKVLIITRVRFDKRS
jgi:O-antigen/teichoic acid export membrane protein